MSDPYHNDRSKQFHKDDEFSRLDMKHVMPYIQERFGFSAPCVVAEIGCLTHDFVTPDDAMLWEHKLDHLYWKSNNVIAEVFSWRNGVKQWLYNCIANRLVVTSDGGEGGGDGGMIHCYDWLPMKKHIINHPLKYYMDSKIGGDRNDMQLLAIPEKKLECFLLWTEENWRTPTTAEVLRERASSIKVPTITELMDSRRKLKLSDAGPE